MKGRRKPWKRLWTSCSGKAFMPLHLSLTINHSAEFTSHLSIRLGCSKRLLARHHRASLHDSPKSARLVAGSCLTREEGLSRSSSQGTQYEEACGLRKPQISTRLPKRAIFARRQLSHARRKARAGAAADTPSSAWHEKAAAAADSLIIAFTIAPQTVLGICVATLKKGRENDPFQGARQFLTDVLAMPGRAGSVSADVLLERPEVREWMVEQIDVLKTGMPRSLILRACTVPYRCPGPGAVAWCLRRSC